MNINREIDFSQNEILLYEIAKKLEQLTKISRESSTTTTTIIP